MSVLRIAIGVIAYDRPRHLEACLEHIERSMVNAVRLPIHIFQDYPIHAPTRHWRRTSAVARHFSDTILSVRQNHAGMFNIHQSIEELFQDYDAAIIVPDDVLVADDFISYMVDSLNRFSDREDIMSVCGEQFELPELAAQPEQAMFARFFLRHGFAIWRRSWAGFDRTCPGWESRCKDREWQREFDIFGGSGLTDLLDKMFRRGEFLFDLTWYYNLVVRRGYSVVPMRSLIFNSGYSRGAHFCSDLFAPRRAWKRLVCKSGLAKLIYQRPYRGRAKRAGSRLALLGQTVFGDHGVRTYADYDSRHLQHSRYAQLLKRWQRTG